MTTGPLHFDPVFNIGHVTSAVLLLGAILGFLYTASEWKTGVVEQQKSFAKQQDQLATVLAPLPEKVRSSEFDIKTLSSSLGDLKDSQVKQGDKLDRIIDTLAKVQQDLAVIKARDGEPVVR